jgi:IclR family transcriptional regulator, pca regulon regulatory protein
VSRDDGTVRVAHDSSRYRIEAVAKALRVLAVFSERTPELRMSEIAELTGLNLSTVFRIVHTLLAEGYLEERADRSFRPTPAVLRLGFAALSGQDLVESAVPHLQRLASQTNEAVNLGVLDGADVVFMHRIRPPDSVAMETRVGSRRPAIGSSMGKVLLAFQPPAEIKRRLKAADLSALRGPNAPDSVAAIARNLDHVRATGWATLDEELVYGMRSIAGPVQNRDGEVVAAISIGGSASKWTMADMIEKLLSYLTDACSAVSLGLGCTTDQLIGRVLR